ncbi:hypothetical protein AB5I41_08480 [Sphingomonas sp. MMS24-JH45]
MTTPGIDVRPLTMVAARRCQHLHRRGRAEGERAGGDRPGRAPEIPAGI